MTQTMTEKPMRIMRCVAVAGAFIVFAPFALMAVGQGPADLSGVWALEVTTDAGGTTRPSVTLEQDGTMLSGHYSSANLGEADVTGTVDGSDFRFSFDGDLGGSPSRWSTPGPFKRTERYRVRSISAASAMDRSRACDADAMHPAFQVERRDEISCCEARDGQRVSNF